MSSGRNHGPRRCPCRGPRVVARRGGREARSSICRPCLRSTIFHHPPHTLPATRAMSQLPELLLASLNPNTRKQAEQNLNSLSQQPGFLPVLLRLVVEPSQDRSVRLAASVFFKNVVRNKWEDVRF